MLFERNETGLGACRDRYGSYIKNILYGILRNREDCEECFDDTLMALWNAIPPERPQSLKNYVGALARNIGINLYEKNRRQKHNIQTEELLEEIVSLRSDDDPEGALLAQALGEKINDFLGSVDKSTRVCFILRYYYAQSVREIAQKTGKSEHAVSALLSKTRNRLKAFLDEDAI